MPKAAPAARATTGLIARQGCRQRSTAAATLSRPQFEHRFAAPTLSAVAAAMLSNKSTGRSRRR